MQQRRVGTLTFGILLIASGIAYLCINILGLPIYNMLLKLWPLVFILLGFETLFLNHLSIKKNTTLRYDFISFILIFITLFFCFLINAQKYVHFYM
ncbi:hypothetical protein CLAUR_018780 [Clostridium felsineum]|nr:hypothetical protein CLAUR_018780 [Clostridium felsineum]URZ17765.1 hypothetical protein CLFE_038200 [Clostridium felsineum DSM 794]